MSDNAWHYNFPHDTYHGRKDELAQLKHTAGEVVEAMDAINYDVEDFIEELMDVVHCAETLIRKTGVDDDTLDRIKCDVIIKNDERGYYDGFSKRE